MLFEQKVLISSEEVQELLNRCTSWEPSRLIPHGAAAPKVMERFRVSDTYLMKVKKGDWFYDRIYKTFYERNVEIIVDEFNVMFYRYREGGFIYKHNDILSNQHHRTAVSILFLGEDFTGGDFIIYDENDKAHILEQTPGTLAIYRPERYHEVTPVESGTRYSAAIFIHQRHCKPVTQSII